MGLGEGLILLIMCMISVNYFRNSYMDCLDAHVVNYEKHLFYAINCLTLLWKNIP